MPPNVWFYQETAADQEGPVSAWHRLGQRIPLGSLPSTVANDMIRFDVTKMPAGYQRPDGTWVTIADKFHLVRDAVDNRPETSLGYVNKDYNFMSSRKLFSQLDPMAQSWPLETAGVLGKGETIFMLFKVGEIEINKDPMSEYFLVNENIDGERGLNLAYVNIRVVCQNTLDLALKKAAAAIKVRHVGDIEEIFLDTHSLMLQLGDARKDMRDMFEAMAKRKIEDDDQLFHLIETAMPTPKQPTWLELAVSKGIKSSRVEEGLKKWELDTSRTLRHQAMIREELDKLDAELSDRAGSLYNFTQAVAAWADHRQERDRKEGLALAAATGYRADAKRRALQEAVNLLKN